MQDEAKQDAAGDVQRYIPRNGSGIPTVVHGMGLLLVAAVLVIYIILGILYESFIHPITILSGLPSAGVGALLTLTLFHQELNLYSFVGIIMLIGIVKKNAIMMIDFALEAERTKERARKNPFIGRARPLPSHHDDDYGGPDGNTAHRDWLWRRVRNRGEVWGWL